MSDGLRPPMPFTVRLVDASHFDVERCLSCGRRLTPRVDAAGCAFVWETDHEVWCMVRALGVAIPFAQTPDSVLDLEPRG